jgi:membrane dipeptidase
MQLSYNKQSPFATGVLGDPQAGLTPLGRKAVAKMNEQGVAIDISHANEATSFGVLQASARPALITHAGCAAVYRHPRNKSDALLRAVAQKGGVVGIYDLPYLTPSPKQPTVDDYMAHMAHALSVCGEDHAGVGSDSDLGAFDTSPKAMADFRKEEEHRHKSGLAAPGEDRPPYVIGLNTPRRSEVIADALLRRGYPARVAEKVLGLNFIRALGRIWNS